MAKYTITKQYVADYWVGNPLSGHSSKTFNVGDVIDAGLMPDGSDTVNVYTTVNGSLPQWDLTGGTLLAIPLENVTPAPAEMTAEKWALLIGITIVAYGIIYWSQKSK
jgi:hypothetical protein